MAKKDNLLLIFFFLVMELYELFFIYIQSVHFLLLG